MKACKTGRPILERAGLELFSDFFPDKYQVAKLVPQTISKVKDEFQVLSL